MAKSLRSKWRRKMRNIKRERYGKKELIRLKKMLGLPTEDDKPAPSADNVIEFSADVEMKPDDETDTNTNMMSGKEIRKISRIVREGSDCEDSDAEKEIQEMIVLTTSRKLRASRRQKLEKQKAKQLSSTKAADGSAVEPATEGGTTEEAMEHDQKRSFNKKTLKDQHGNYPIWMNQKRMRTLAKSNRKLKRKEKKRLAKAIGRRPVRRDDRSERSEDSELDIEEVEGEEKDQSETAIQDDTAGTTLNTSTEAMQAETIEIE